MKKLKSFIISFIVCLAFCANTHAQNLTYNTVASDSIGQVHINQTISLRISIMQGGTSSPVIYSEKFVVTGDSLGVVSFTFGSGTVLSGALSNINWQSSNYARIDCDPNAGNNFGKVGNSMVNTVTHMLIPNQ
jgi:hypothetical protein